MSGGPGSTEAELSQVRQPILNSQMKPGGQGLGLERREQICFFLPDLQSGPFAPRPGLMSPTATSTPPDTRILTCAWAYTPARGRRPGGAEAVDLPGQWRRR